MNRLAKPLITKEDILFSTAGGLDIYRKIVSLKQNGRKWVGLCPFHSEKTGSFTVFGDRFSYKCFGCSEGGVDAIKFLQRYYNISFKEALEMAQRDFNITSSSSIIKSSVPIVKSPMEIDFIDCKFTPTHTKYWNQYLLPEEYLRRKNVYAVESWFINKVKQKIKDDEIVFAYDVPELGKSKILRIGPSITKRDKWRNNLPNTFIWDLPKQPVEELWLNKSRKDGFVMEYHFGKASVALQNEDAKIYLNSKNYEIVERLCPAENIICAMGVDRQGKEQSITITKERGYKWFNIQNYMLDYGLTDVSDVIAEFGIDIIQKDLIKKGML